MRSKIKILIAILTLTIVSCIKEYNFDTKEEKNLRSAEIRIPVAKLHIPLYASIEKFLEFEELKIREDGVLYVEYVHTETIGWSDDIDISIKPFSATWETEIDLGDWDVVVPGLVFELPKIEFDYGINLIASADEADSHVSKAELSDGKIIFSVVEEPNNISEWEINIEIDRLRNISNGLPFTKTFTHSSADIGVPMSVAGYMIEADDNNMLNAVCSFEGKATGIPSGNFKIYFDITDLEFSYLAGYFGQFDFSQTGEMLFDFFDELEIDGEVGLQGVTIKTEIINYTGLPMQLTGLMKFTNEEEDAAADENDNDGIIIIDVLAADNRDTPKKSEGTHNIPPIELGNQNYSMLKFDVKGIVNPGVNPVENFVAKIPDVPLADLAMTIEIPFDFRLTYSREDNVGFDYREMMADFGGDNAQEFSESINNFTLYLSIENNMPFEVDLDIYATNDTGEKVEISKLEIKRGLRSVPIKITRNTLSQLWEKDVKNMVIATSAKTIKTDGSSGYAQITTSPDVYLNIDISVELESDIPKSLIPFLND